MREAVNSLLRWAEPRSWLVIFPLLAGLLLRPGIAGDTGGLFNDEDGRQYYSAAESAKKHGMFLSPDGSGKPYAYRMPYYPAFLSFFAGGPGEEGEESVSRALAAVSLLLILLTYLIARSVAPNLLALGAAFFMALSGPAARIGADADIQGFFALVVCVFVLAGIDYLRRPGTAAAALWGLAAGLCLQVRSAMFAAPVIAAFFMLREKRGGRHTAVLLLACLPLLAPWTARNFVHFGEFIPFEDGAGLANLYTASLGLDTPAEDSALPFGTQETRTRFERADPDGRARLLTGEIKANIAASPGGYILGAARRFLKIAFKFPLLIPGVLVCFIGRGRVGLFLAVFCLYFTGLHSAMSVQGRYLFPMFPAVLAVSACFLAYAARAGGVPPPARAGFEVRPTLLALILLGLAVYARELLYLSREILLLS